MSEVKRKCVGSSRIYCDHCDDYVSRSTFYAHRKLAKPSCDFQIYRGREIESDSDSESGDPLYYDSLSGNCGDMKQHADHLDGDNSGTQKLIR